MCCRVRCSIVHRISGCAAILLFARYFHHQSNRFYNLCDATILLLFILKIRTMRPHSKSAAKLLRLFIASCKLLMIKQTIEATIYTVHSTHTHTQQHAQRVLPAKNIRVRFEGTREANKIYAQTRFR